MNNEQALAILEVMPEDEFQEFFASLPQRTKMLVRSGMVNWREVLPEHFLKQTAHEYEDR